MGNLTSAASAIYLLVFFRALLPPQVAAVAFSDKVWANALFALINRGPYLQYTHLNQIFNTLTFPYLVVVCGKMKK